MRKTKRRRMTRTAWTDEFCQISLLVIQGNAGPSCLPRPLGGGCLPGKVSRNEPISPVKSLISQHILTGLRQNIKICPETAEWMKVQVPLQAALDCW